MSEQARDFRMHDPLWRSLYMNVLMFFHDKIAWIKIHFCGYNEIKRFGWRRIVICVRAAICYLGEWMCFSWLFESEHFMEYYKNWCLLGWLVGKACFAVTRLHQQQSYVWLVCLAFLYIVLFSISKAVDIISLCCACIFRLFIVSFSFALVYLCIAFFCMLSF